MLLKELKDTKFGSSSRYYWSYFSYHKTTSSMFETLKLHCSPSCIWTFYWWHMSKFGPLWNYWMQKMMCAKDYVSLTQRFQLNWWEVVPPPSVISLNNLDTGKLRIISMKGHRAKIKSVLCKESKVLLNCLREPQKKRRVDSVPLEPNRFCFGILYGS